jgi:tetratricopeptide (TPR) repeat protein
MRTHYEVLGVSPRADLDTIKRAFRIAAKAHHPDLRGGADAAAEHKLKMIIVAYKVLRDHDLRAEYDAHLASERNRIRRERWDAILQFAATTAVLSVVLIGLEMLLLPSLGDWMSRAPPTRSPTPSARSPTPAAPQPRPEPQREAAAEPPAQNVAPAAPSPAAPQPLATAAPAPPPATEAKPAEPDRPTPATASSFLKLALERSRQGDLDRAIADFDEAVRLAPRNSDIYRYRARDLGRMGRWDRALADYDRAIRLDPNNPALFHDRALALQHKGELDEALVDFDRAVRMSFRDAEVYSDRGAAWLAKGSYDRALADFNQALKLDPGLATAAARRDEALERKREQQVAGEGPGPSQPGADTTGALPAEPRAKAAPN